MKPPKNQNQQHSGPNIQQHLPKPHDQPSFDLEELQEDQPQTLLELLDIFDREVTGARRRLEQGAISGRYGVPKKQLRFACIREFINCSKRESESVDAFVERYKVLKARSGVVDKHFCALVFFDSFPDATAHLMTVAKGQASEQSFYDINYLSGVARRLEMAVGSKAGNGVDSSGGRRKRESSDVFSTSQELKKSKHAPAFVSSVVAEAARPFGVKTKFVSRFGKTIGEHIADRTCKDCNGPFTNGHKCGTGVRGGAGGADGKTIRVMAKGPSAKAAAKSALRAIFVNPVVNEKSVRDSVVSLAASFVGAHVVDISDETVASPVESMEVDLVMSCVDGMEADLVDDHDDLKGCAEATLVDGMSNVSLADAELAMNMAAQECKVDAVFSAPPTMRSNSICVPLLVRNVSCFGFVDTGATFSSFVYWGVINGKLMPDGRKLTNIAQWPAIKTGRQLASFLGLMSYFRFSIPCFSRLTKDLDSLKQYKNLAAVWNESYSKAIADLKEALTMALVMSPPDFTTCFHLATDASQTAMGVMLYEIVDDQIRYVGLVSRNLTISERSYKVPNAMMLGWWETFCSYTFDIAHLPGIFNVIPDALSGLYEDDADVSARHLLGGRYYADGDELIKRKEKSSSKLKTASASKIKMKHAPVRVTRVLRSASDSDSSKPVALHEELILRTLRFADYITPPASEIDNMIISQHLVGHFGIKHVENAFHKESFHWKNLRQDIKRILDDCIECNKFNIAKEAYHSFCSNNPALPLDGWCMDLGDMGVTSTFGNKFLFVLTDLFTRFAVVRWIPDKHATAIARELLQVFSLFGWPKQLTSDRGAEFVNQVIEAMMDIGGIDRRRALAYNPLGNSSAESYIKLTKATTIKLINARLHKSSRYTLLFNRQPNGLADYSKEKPTDSSEIADEKIINERFRFVQDVLIPAISKLIIVAQAADHANKVMIKNVNRQNKLDERYEGPYLIHNVPDSGSYTLMDKTGALLSRDIPAHQIVYNAAANLKLTSVDEFLHWKGFDDPIKNTWDPAQNFDSTKYIELYWDRRGSAKTTGKRQSAPKTVNRRKAAARKEKRSKQQTKRS
ncbi:hypothetical protein [Parasitella parasitica]|uniref:Integrase catalytic domain-containing protein n=1 Tax=Parasitella parasitica TaxID=35722 RepID=A0A0B7N5W3_9FUNG|nr:hypothetical protein [Parasitella parasitica]